MLDHLSGYEGARPVRIGNDAYKQRQHDVWGALLDSVYLHTRSRDALDERVWPILKRQVEAAIANWREPTAASGRSAGEPQALHLLEDVLLGRLRSRRAPGGGRATTWSTRERWREAADEIHADICEHGIDERGVFVQHYETTALDAALLLMPLLRFLPPSDERIRNTVFAIADELTEDGLVLRYRTGGDRRRHVRPGGHAS